MIDLTLDKYVFRWVKEQLVNATPDQIVGFYIDKFIFHNTGYLEYLQAKYKLPNDFLKLHKKVIELAETI